MQPLLAALDAVSVPKGKSTCRATGPYQDRQQFRVKFTEGDRKWSQVYETRTAALSAMRAFEKRTAQKEALTVGQLIAQFIEAQTRRGIQPQTVAHQGWRCHVFLGYTGLLPRPVGHVTADVARQAYEANTKRPKARGGHGPVAVSTHQGDLNHARRLFEWAVEEKLVSSNPFTGVKPIGRANRGKHQLSMDDATRWLAAAEQLVTLQGDVTALAAAVVATTGARNSEVMFRRVRDLDEGGSLLRITKGKTAKSNRPLRIPTKYVPCVAALASGRSRDALLFVPFSDLEQPEPTGHTLRLRLIRKVKQICAMADVDKVVPHSFRGLYATLGVCRTGDPNLIASLLGHASPGITERNYIDSRVAAVAQQERVQNRLGVTPPRALLAPTPAVTPAANLDTMSPEALHDLMQRCLAAMSKPGLMVGSTRPTKRIVDRSKSNTEQVGVSVRNRSAPGLIGPFSDGE